MADLLTSASLFLLGPTLGPTELILVLVALLLHYIPFRIAVFFRKRSEGKKKSHVFGIALVIIFGPLGLAYSTRGGWWDVAVFVGGIVWTLLAIVVTPMATAAISVVSLAASIFAVKNQNRKLAQENESSSPVMANA